MKHPREPAAAADILVVKKFPDYYTHLAQVEAEDGGSWVKKGE